MERTMVTKANIFVFCIGTFIFIYLSSLYNYLLFHSIAELFSIVVCFAIYMFSRNSRRFLENDYLVFLGIAYLFIGILDLLHTLSYKGMGVFPGFDANLPTQLWISARYLESLSFLISPLFLVRRFKILFYYFGYASVLCLLMLSIFYWQFFPDCYIENSGMTAFKKISEYVISLILIGSMGLLYTQRREFDKDVYRLVIYSITLTVLAELAFTFYIGVYDFSNLIGHYFKIISFYLIYKAIIETGLEKPYDLMFRNLKKSEKELQSANNTKDTFFSIIAHDLRNPFQALMSGTDFLTKNIAKFDKDTIKNLIEQLNLTAENTYNLLQNLLAWSRSQTGAMVWKPAEFQFSGIVYSVMTILDYQAREKEISIHCEVSDDLVVFADADMISSVVRNLITNGLKFTRPGGKIKIIAKNKGNMVVITVTDTGVGITKEKMDHLFRIDKKQSTLGTNDEAGTGIGLILCKEFVEKNGGTISVESSPGEGSAFSFTLPKSK